MNDQTRKITRRRFLKLTGGIVGVTVLACGGTVAFGLRLPAIEFAKSSCGKEKTVGEKILIAYASRAGSTGEVAEAIGKGLCDAGVIVDVLRVQEVKDLSSYQGIVLGSAIRMGKPLPEAVSFAKKHQAALTNVPVALFSLGTTMNADTPERRTTAMSALAPLLQVMKPASVGLFGGKVDPSKLGGFLRFALSFIKEGDMAPGDHRNWEAIRAWAKDLSPLLVSKA